MESHSLFLPAGITRMGATLLYPSPTSPPSLPKPVSMPMQPNKELHCSRYHLLQRWPQD